ncbi:unnamed protein product [Tenebrio molitor]|nr:unnamed protein product [Tenebrio molitor]
MLVVYRVVEGKSKGWEFRREEKQIRMGTLNFPLNVLRLVFRLFVTFARCDRRKTVK